MTQIDALVNYVSIMLRINSIIDLRAFRGNCRKTAGLSSNAYYPAYQTLENVLMCSPKAYYGRVSQ